MASRLVRGVVIACMTLAGVACGQMPAAAPLTSDQVLAASTIKDSQFDKSRLVSTPRIVSKHQRGGGLYTFTDTVSTTLSVSQDKGSGVVTFLLTATVEYGGRWRFYRTASLAGGFTLVEKAASRQVESCRGVECEFFESVVFELPSAVMLSSSETGFAARLNADAGPALEVVVAAPYVVAMISIAQAMASAAGRISTVPAAPTQKSDSPGASATRSVAIGPNSHQIERMPEAKACAAMPVANLVRKAPGLELYTVACANGDALTVRCEFSACRVLK